MYQKLNVLFPLSKYIEHVDEAGLPDGRHNSLRESEIGNL